MFMRDNWLVGSLHSTITYHSLYVTIFPDPLDKGSAGNIPARAALPGKDYSLHTARPRRKDRSSLGSFPAHLQGLHSQHCDQSCVINNSIPLLGILDFAVSAEGPLLRMPHHSSPHHVEINIDQAFDQMLTAFHSRGMITIFPKGSSPLLSLICTAVPFVRQ